MHLNGILPIIGSKKTNHKLSKYISITKCRPLNKKETKNVLSGIHAQYCIVFLCLSVYVCVCVCTCTCHTQTGQSCC